MVAWRLGEFRMTKRRFWKQSRLFLLGRLHLIRLAERKTPSPPNKGEGREEQAPPLRGYGGILGKRKSSRERAFLFRALFVAFVDGCYVVFVLLARRAVNRFVVDFVH